MLMRAGADISIRGPKGKTAVDAARMQYGEPDAARRQGMDAAVLALLTGRTWAEVKRQAAARERLARKWPRGKVFRDCEGCPEMVVVPAGSFMMGSPASEKDRTDAEGPVHRVTISRPFAVGKYEVTREEFGRFVSATGRSMGNSCYTFEDGKWQKRSGRSWQNPGYRQTGRDPAVCVTWEDAQAYVRWLSGETGKQYRLLSEAEREYAARAGMTTRYSWGDLIGRNRANCGKECGDNYDYTAPVGSFAANGFGLHDMHGNVWEWVEDCWHGSYAGAPSDGSGWVSGGDCGRRVLRGGSWDGYPGNLRSASRLRYDPGGRSGYLGFRVARTLAP